MRSQQIIQVTFQDYTTQVLPESTNSIHINEPIHSQHQNLKPLTKIFKFGDDEQEESNLQQKHLPLRPAPLSYSRFYENINALSSSQQMANYHEISPLSNQHVQALPIHQDSIVSNQQSPSNYQIHQPQLYSLTNLSPKPTTQPELTQIASYNQIKPLNLYTYDIFQSKSSKLLVQTDPVKSMAKNSLASKIPLEVEFESKSQTIFPEMNPHSSSEFGREMELRPKHEQLKASDKIDSSKNQQDRLYQIQHPQQQKQEEIQFPGELDTTEYLRVHEHLQNIKDLLKSQAEPTLLLKQIKRYLEVIASGKLDEIGKHDSAMSLHRKKVLKLAFIYERISVVILALAYALGELKSSIKYVINLVSYTVSSSLLIIKVLQTTYKRGHCQSKNERLALSRNVDTLRNNNEVILDLILHICKLNSAFYENFKEMIKNATKVSLELTFYRVLEYFAFFLCVSDLQKSIPFMAVAPNPYLPQVEPEKYTLVIDVISVFCPSAKPSKNQLFRPHGQYFLNQLSQRYEIIAFTDGFPNQIDKVIDILDSGKVIKHRLYRHHSLQRQGYLFKDMERLGRNLNKIILLEAEPSNHCNINPHSLTIPCWKMNKNDATLIEVCPVLAQIVLRQLDCLSVVQKIRAQRTRNQEEGIKYFNFGLNID